MLAPRRIPLGAVLALLAVLTSLPLAVFAGALIYRTSKHQQEQIDRQNIEVARAISGAVDDEIEHTEAALAVLASIVPSDPSGLEAFYRICEETVAMQDWQAIRLATPSGDIVLSTDAPFGTAVHTRSADWILRAAATAASSISSVRMDPDLKRWIVAIGVPVKKGTSVRYVIGARLFTRGFSEILQRQQLPPGGIVTLLDDTPAIVARTVNEAANIGHPPGLEFGQKIYEQAEGASRATTLEGTPSYTAWNRSTETGWTIGVGLPVALVDRPISRSLFALIAGACSLMATGLIAALFVRRRLVESQRAIADAARALARGEPIAPRPSTIAEIQDLSAALSEAARILETRLRERDEAQQEAERQRSAALEREQAGRRAAEALSRAKDEFVATVSHELRTPLNAIFGWVTLLQTDTLDAARHKQGLEVIHRNAAAQLALINDLLDMSRVLRGTMRLDMQPIDLGMVVDAAIDALLPTAEARRITVNVSAPRGTALISGDQSRVQQIIFNLVSNSLKFTPGAGRIDVRLWIDRDEAVLEVSDTGEGIAAEFLPHVFDRFRQEESHEARPHEGLGLGLSLVRHLSELHGGTVTAESAGKGQGAAFRLRLPLLGARAVATASTATVPSTAGSVGRPLNGARVLVVDDDADARDLISMVIRGAGGMTVAAASVSEAKDAIDTGVPDAIVSDIAMPGGNGYEFARDLRGDGRTDSLPLVAVTAYTRVEDRDRAIAAGFDAHLGKPFEPRALVGLIAGLILNAKQDSGSRPSSHS
ncbi:MAG TPA: ATP-binding protein [Vicinamibacterales bacterium]|nr:ATP-binding protein [Vicinamibacterales bacterium]